MKKVLIAMFAVSALSCPSMAADSSLFNAGDFLSGTRAGYAINQHLERSAVFYKPFKSFRTTAGLELVNLNAGYDGLQKRPLLALGLRLDNLDSLLWSGTWGRKHVVTAKLPTFEFGPYASVWPIKTSKGYAVSFFYGVAGAIGFDFQGGK